MCLAPLSKSCCPTHGGRVGPSLVSVIIPFAMDVPGLPLRPRVLRLRARWPQILADGLSNL
jgi:hypothetical protein